MKRASEWLIWDSKTTPPPALVVHGVRLVLDPTTPNPTDPWIRYERS